MNFLKNIFKNKSSSKEKKESKFLPKKKIVIEERFIQKFIQNGGKFLYCENLNEVKNNFEKILKENDWQIDDIFVMNPVLLKEFKIEGLSKSKLENRKCFITDCENLIASDGSILISSNQINEKKISEFPENFIIFSDTKKFSNSISEGLSEIKLSGKEIPTNITTIKNFNDEGKDKNFLSYGTSSKNLYLILLEKGFK